MDDNGQSRKREQNNAYHALISIRDIQTAMHKLLPKGVSADNWYDKMTELDRQIFELQFLKLESAARTLKSGTVENNEPKQTLMWAAGQGMVAI